MRTGSFSVIALVLLLSGCNGVIGNPGADPGGPTTPGRPPPGGCVGAACLDVEEVPSPAPRFRRLTHTQWENTVVDLFHLDAPPGLAASFNSDPAIGKFEEDVRRLSVTAGLWRDYQRAAETIAEQATADMTTLATWAPTATDGASFIRDFGQRAYRRPLADAEVTRLVRLWDEGPGQFPSMDPRLAAIRLTLEGMLQSPNFLYRVERSTDTADGLVPLSDWEMATRLSYFLWGTMPDDALFEAAASGELRTEEGIRAQATRLLADDARVDATFRHFHVQLYDLESWGDIDKNTDVFPDWTPALGAKMEEEVQQFLSGVVRNDGSISDFLLSRTAYVDEDLAGLYGVEGVTGSEYQEVELPADRAGLLTRLGFLTKNATLTEPDPIHRGVFINISVLCREITAPPVIPDDLMPVGDTNRERINSITGPGTCGAGCHGTIINPLGFALESFDAIGQLRPDDNGFPLDTAATYVFSSGDSITYDGAIEMSQALAESPAPHECYATRLVELAQGRAINDDDSPLVYRSGAGSLDGTMTIKDVILELVTSRSFRTRATAELEVSE